MKKKITTETHLFHVETLIYKTNIKKSRVFFQETPGILKEKIN